MVNKHVSSIDRGEGQSFPVFFAKTGINTDRETSPKFIRNYVTCKYRQRDKNSCSSIERHPDDKSVHQQQQQQHYEAVSLQSVALSYAQKTNVMKKMDAHQ